MASEEIDKLWDGWGAALNQSAGKTMDLLRENKTAAAAQEFRTGFGLTVRKMYTEMASVGPKRFAALDTDQWGAWAMGLYVRMRKTENALAQGDADEARKGQEALREHFYTLHKKAGKLKTSDVIYQINKIAQGKEPTAEALKASAAELEKAEPVLDAKAKAEEYAKARAEWNEAVEAILKDGRIETEELAPLRQAAEKAYRRLGYQLE